MKKHFLILIPTLSFLVVISADYDAVADGMTPFLPAAAVVLMAIAFSGVAFGVITKNTAAVLYCSFAIVIMCVQLLYADTPSDLSIDPKLDTNPRNLETIDDQKVSN